jgi:hypothetical protein
MFFLVHAAVSHSETQAHAQAQEVAEWTRHNPGFVNTCCVEEEETDSSDGLPGLLMKLSDGRGGGIIDLRDVANWGLAMRASDYIQPSLVPCRGLRCGFTTPGPGPRSTVVAYFECGCFSTVLRNT